MHRIVAMIGLRSSLRYLSSTSISKLSLVSEFTTHYLPPSLALSTISRNENLDFVKEQGLQVLDHLTKDVSSKTKQRLLIEDMDAGPTSYQLREAGRIKLFVQEAIDQYTSRFGKQFCIDDEPIVIIDAEISHDLRQARVFWCIPFSILISPNLSIKLLENITIKMQTILNDHGGILQGMVHSRMRTYHHHASLKFVPAESSFLRETLQRSIPT